MKARLTFNGILLDEIAVDNGVKQGDILAATLFSIYFAVLLSHAFQDCEAGVSWKFGTSGKIFNLRRFNTKPKNFECLIWELLYADDACNAFGLTIILKKTKVIFTSAPGKLYKNQQYW